MMHKIELRFEKFRHYFNSAGTFSLVLVCVIALLWMMKEYFHFIMICFVTDQHYIKTLNGLQKSLTFAGLGIYPLLGYSLLSYIKKLAGDKKVGKNIQASASSILVKGLK